MKIERIFLDVDDVLADFSLAALEYLGVERSSIDLDSYYERWGYDIVKAVNDLHPFTTFSVTEFWARLPRSFWANLKITKECDYTIQAAKRIVGRENVFLLTAPINDPECAAAKMEWIRDFVPEFWDNRQFLIGPPKWACAYPGALLIDDSDANVDKFREKGGLAALVPRPWNSGYSRQKDGMMFDIL